MWMKKGNDIKKKRLIVGLIDIIACILLLTSAMIGFIGINRVGIVSFWILIGSETLLVFVSWFLLLISPTYLRAIIGLKVIHNMGSLRSTNNIIFLIFKPPIVLLLAYLNNFCAAFFIIASMFFEEHMVVLMEKSIKKLIIRQYS
jgi:hypothetical protein